MMPDINPTPAQRREIIETLKQRNRIRGVAQMPLIDIPEAYQEEIEIIRRQNFHDRLAPYIALARCGVTTPSGLVGNICAYHHARHIALELFAYETGFNPMELPVSEPLRMQLIDKLTQGEQ